MVVLTSKSGIQIHIFKLVIWMGFWAAAATIKLVRTIKSKPTKGRSSRYFRTQYFCTNFGWLLLERTRTKEEQKKTGPCRKNNIINFVLQSAVICIPSVSYLSMVWISLGYVTLNILKRCYGIMFSP